MRLHLCFKKVSIWWASYYSFVNYGGLCRVQDTHEIIRAMKSSTEREKTVRHSHKTTEPPLFGILFHLQGCIFDLIGLLAVSLFSRRPWAERCCRGCRGFHSVSSTKPWAVHATSSRWTCSEGTMGSWREESSVFT